MKCNFCDKKAPLKKMEALICADLKSNKKETVIVELCNNCIKRIKGEIE